MRQIFVGIIRTRFVQLLWIANSYPMKRSSGVKCIFMFAGFSRSRYSDIIPSLSWALHIVINEKKHHSYKTNYHSFRAHVISILSPHLYIISF